MTDESARLQGYWRDEMEAAQTYERLAQAAVDERSRRLLLKMRDAELRHAARWEARIRELGGELPPRPSGRRARWLGLLARLGGQERVFRQLEAVERGAVAGYGAGLADAESSRIAAEAQADERGHAAALRALARPEAKGSETILTRERWHRGGGGTMRELIFGINDGLVSTLSLVSGVAGADPGRGVVLLAGLAGLLAGALSMAAGAYISSKSEREVHEAEVSREREEVERNPEEEKEELRILYQLKGFSLEEAERLVERVSQEGGLFLEGLVRDELGLMPESFPNPWKAGAFSGGAFIIGAIVPLVGYFFLEGVPAVLLSAGLSVTALFVIGALKTLFTGLPWLKSGLEMVGIGILATAITYLIGRMFGVQLS
ncbi:MAG: VIT1/CCC1 transporter family protein [Chloroflexota bacterium]